MPHLKPFEEHSAAHLRLILQTGHIGIWELDVATGIASRNSEHDAIFGYDAPLERWTYDIFQSHVVPEDRERVDALQKSTIAQAKLWSFDCAIRTVQGDRKWISAAGRPLLADDGSVDKLIGHVIDITHTKQRENRLTLLTDELNHRVRNMLAIIKSIVRLSSRKAHDISSFAEALEGRVEALARSHRLMVSDAAETMPPSAILESELAAFPGLEQRIELDIREETALPGAVGQGLALVFHELITNALKYGALSDGAGIVAVRIEQIGDRLDIAWRERDGPPVAPIHDNGFGSRLIGDAIGSTGKVDLRFPEHGVECDISLDTA